MKTIGEKIAYTGAAMALSMGALVCSSTEASAAPSPTTNEIEALQRDMNADQDRLGMPTLTEDGKLGRFSRRALCAQRWLTGRKPSLADPTSAEIKQLVAEDRYTTPYKDIVVSKICQVLVLDGTVVTKMIPVSTGKVSTGNTTPNFKTTASHGRYGWHDSSKYPTEDGSGNMYKPVYFAENSTYAIHGSRAENDNVTTAESHGCIRTSVGNQEMIWKFVGGPGIAQQDQYVSVRSVDITVLP